MAASHDGSEKNNFRSFIYGHQSFTIPETFVKIGLVYGATIGLKEISKNIIKK